MFSCFQRLGFSQKGEVSCFKVHGKKLTKYRIMPTVMPYLPEYHEYCQRLHPFPTYNKFAADDFENIPPQKMEIPFQ